MARRYLYDVYVVLRGVGGRKVSHVGWDDAERWGAGQRDLGFRAGIQNAAGKRMDREAQRPEMERGSSQDQTREPEARLERS